MANYWNVPLFLIRTMKIAQTIRLEEKFWLAVQFKKKKFSLKLNAPNE